MSAVIYVDFRAAARILLGDAGIRAPIDRTIVTTSALLEIELQRMLERLKSAKRISDATYATKRRECERLIGALHVFPIGDEVVELAREEYPFSVASVDTIHVATAQLVAREAADLEVWTHDTAVAAAAAHRGLVVKGIESKS